MRKFKFVGNESYLWDNKPILNRIYNGDYVWNYNGVKGAPLSEWAHEFPNEWQEVFEPTLQDRIQDLKSFAKSQGLSVDVVVDNYRRTPKEHYEYIIKLFDEKIAEMEKVDIWDGVEFYKSKWSGGIFPINRIDLKLRDGILIEDWIPSTESAYVDQLKKEAFERFGEIKAQDCFSFEK